MWEAKTLRDSHLDKAVNPCYFDINKSTKCHCKMNCFKGISQRYLRSSSGNFFEVKLDSRTER